MVVFIENESNSAFDQDLKEIIEKVVTASVQYENFPEKGEVSVLIVGDEEIHRINKEHRKIDKATDVLSFPIIDFEKGQYPPENDSYLLGDIVISIDTAKRQAEEYGHSIVREIGFLTAHSMLHLMGYDHMNEADEKEMFAKQKEILDNLNLKR